MSIRRLILGFSILALVVGLLAACFAPGGWLSDWTPRSYYTGGFQGWFNNLLERLGFAKSTAIPFVGLLLSILGAVGLIIGWAIHSPKPESPTRVDTDSSHAMREGPPPV